MERVSDTVTSVFPIAIKDKRPVACASAGGAIVWSDIFGLGWRFGISYDPSEWFAKVRMYLDHNHSHTEQDQATVTIFLGDTPDKSATKFLERVTTIADFGHGQPARLGSWSLQDLTSHPYVSITLTTKTRIPQLSADPLSSATLALRQSMVSGDFVDTKFYAFSAKSAEAAAGKPRVVYANNTGIGLVLPKATGAREGIGLAPDFLVNMTFDDHINHDSVLHEYEYELDSDLDDESGDDAERQSDAVPSDLESRPLPSSKPPTPRSRKRGGRGGKTDNIPAEPPAYSVSNCRMILVKGVAYKTWATYIYYRYTGQVSFLPLTSAKGSSRERSLEPNQPPTCSPKSMYRLADKLGDARMKELAFRAIKEGLTKDNIIEEAFSWFTAQYPDISAYEVDRVSELRKSPEVSSALKRQLKGVSHGEKPWAHGVLIAIMDKLNPSETPA